MEESFGWKLVKIDPRKVFHNFYQKVNDLKIPAGMLLDEHPGTHFRSLTSNSGSYGHFMVPENSPATFCNTFRYFFSDEAKFIAILFFALAAKINIE